MESKKNASISCGNKQFGILGYTANQKLERQYNSINYLHFEFHIRSAVYASFCIKTANLCNS